MVGGREAIRGMGGDGQRTGGEGSGGGLGDGWDRPSGPPSGAARGSGLRALSEPLGARPPFPRPVSTIALSPHQRTLLLCVDCSLLRTKVPSRDGPPASLLGLDLLHLSSVWPAGFLPGSCMKGRGSLTPSWLMTWLGSHSGKGPPAGFPHHTEGARWGVSPLLS